MTNIHFFLGKNCLHNKNLRFIVKHKNRLASVNNKKNLIFLEMKELTVDKYIRILGRY